jgi:hypothetical protein
MSGRVTSYQAIAARMGHAETRSQIQADQDKAWGRSLTSFRKRPRRLGRQQTHERAARTPETASIEQAAESSFSLDLYFDI